MSLGHHSQSLGKGERLRVWGTRLGGGGETVSWAPYPALAKRGRVSLGAPQPTLGERGSEPRGNGAKP